MEDEIRNKIEIHFQKKEKYGCKIQQNKCKMFGFWTNEASLELEIRVDEFRRRVEYFQLYDEPTTPPTPPVTPATMTPPSSPPPLVRTNPPNYYTPRQLEFESDDE